MHPLKSKVICTVCLVTEYSFLSASIIARDRNRSIVSWSPTFSNRRKSEDDGDSSSIFLRDFRRTK